MNYITEILFGLKQKYCLNDCYPMVEPLLLHAVHDSNPQIVETLLKQGMSPNETCQHKITPLQVAVQNDDDKCVDLLVKFGADINTHVTVIDADEEKIDMTPLVIASCLNFTKIVQKLLNANANMNEKVHQGQNALTFALASNANESAKMLLDYGAFVNSKDTNETTPIMIAAKHGNPKIIKSLLAKGATVNCSNKFRETALVLAAKRGSAECVKILLEEGADSNVTNFSNSNLLIEAQWFKSSETTKIVQLLIESGCSVNISNDFGETPLSCAVSNSSVTETNMLLRAGANPNIGHPLKIAASSGNKIIVTTLISAGANPKCLDKELCEEETYHMVNKLQQNLQENNSLKNLCRQMIRKHLINKCSKSNIITSMQNLYLPNELKIYLLYDVIQNIL